MKTVWKVSLHKKWSFPLRISSVNFVTFTEEILNRKLHFLYSEKRKTYLKEKLHSIVIGPLNINPLRNKFDSLVYHIDTLVVLYSMRLLWLFNLEFLNIPPFSARTVVNTALESW